MNNKTKSSFYRRLYIAYMIDCGYNTLPKIQQQIDIPRRTAQDTINALIDLDIQCTFTGASKNGCYHIESWGPFNRDWIVTNITHIKIVLGY